MDGMFHWMPTCNYIPSMRCSPPGSSECGLMDTRIPLFRCITRRIITHRTSSGESVCLRSLSAGSRAERTRCALSLPGMRGNPTSSSGCDGCRAWLVSMAGLLCFRTVRLRNLNKNQSRFGTKKKATHMKQTQHKLWLLALQLSGPRHDSNPRRAE